VVFNLLGLPVTQTVVTTWVMIIVLGVLAIVAGKRVKVSPAYWQAVVEWGVRSVDSIIGDVAGTKGRTYLPLVVTLGLFVLVANEIAVLPFVNAPTADLNTPIALALVVFFSVHVVGIREQGLVGYVKQFAQPNVLLLPLNILHQFSRTFSLAIRLFGNMFSHQLVVAVLLLILPVIVPALVELFGLFIGILQAYIFTILTIVYLGGAMQAEGG
jgi:F-type H+-transporting ATPase subunit a